MVGSRAPVEMQYASSYVCSVDESDSNVLEHDRATSLAQLDGLRRISTSKHRGTSGVPNTTVGP